MDAVFPFGLPTSTAFYVTLFVATLLLHFVFMGYVFAGTTWMTVGLMLNRKDGPSPVVALLKDWMPVMLSGAITAGVAPLLFLQILYRQEFYTANLLLFHRWMLILPVLIALFYLLYLVKARGLTAKFPWLPTVAATLALSCVVFVGWSWVENHQLSLAGQAAWSEMYASEQVAYSNPVIVIRLALWFATTFPVMCCIVAWQLRWTQRASTGEPAAPQGNRRTSAVALCGLVTSAALTVLMFFRLEDGLQQTLMSVVAVPWLIVGLTGWIVQAAGWWLSFRSGRPTVGILSLISGGCVLHLAGLLVGRETLRLSVLLDTIDFIEHADAAKTDGLVLFVLFAVVNTAAITWCIRTVKRHVMKSAAE